MRGLQQGAADGAPADVAAVGVAQVDNRHVRQRTPGDAFGEREQLELTRGGLLPRFERGRGAAQHERDALAQGALPGDVAGVVTRGGVLLEGGLVLFVDHDQAQVAGRGEDGAAGADDHLHLTPQDAAPLVVALDVRLVAVQHGDGVEARAEAAHRLRREADLGHEHDGLPAGGDDAVDRLQVDLGLAAARDAVEDEALGLLRVESGDDHVEGGLLVVV